MDSERSHRTYSRTNSTATDLFPCFSSSSASYCCFSSMKTTTSKSTFSPGHPKHHSSLSWSFTRKLTRIKSSQHASPVFPKKHRSATDNNPEPSSPKVTCIGQVRVKTKNRTKKLRRSRSTLRGDATSFTRQQQLRQECLPNRNQRWFHLPLTICEALKSCGSEFNCFSLCRSSCMSTRESKEKERDVDLAVEDEEDNTEIVSRRRHVFEEMVFEEERCQEEEEEEEEEARASISVPPKNALLLMRCRSDPVKMAALDNRFWEESSAPKIEDQIDESDKNPEEHDDKAANDGQESSQSDLRRELSLPECLVLMMCEPKVSTDVSQETWVCSTDFIRIMPERRAGGEKIVPEKRVSAEEGRQAPRSSSSCSYNVQVMDTKKKANNAYKPFVLTRCKSEPVRSSAKIAATLPFLWKNRTSGATGVGY